MLGLNPAALDAVRLEGIASLPEVITRLDTTSPVIVPTVIPPPNVNGWNNSAVSVSWNVTDPESGISSSTGCTATSLTTQTSGTVVTCSATNAAGLHSTVSVTIKIDMTPPAAISSALTLPNANNWNSGSVTVGFTGTDSLSGIDTCTAPVVVNTEERASLHPPAPVPIRLEIRARQSQNRNQYRPYRAGDHICGSNAAERKRLEQHCRHAELNCSDALRE